MKHVMIDLETWATGRDAVIVQVGAVYFDAGTGELGNTFKRNIDARSTKGGVINPDTVYWWLSQAPAAIASITANGNTEDKVLMDLNNFLSGAEHIWSHATFDFVLIQDAFRRHGIKPSFPYKSAKDIRTLVFLAGKNMPKVEREGVHHDALDDAIFQVKYCVGAIQQLKGGAKL